MNCAWREYLRLVPPRMHDDVNESEKDNLQELRLRIGRRPMMVTAKGARYCNGLCTADDLNYVINSASKYSPWLATTMADGYITAAGGHRVGICGEAVVKEGIMTGIRYPTSLCIRTARDIEGIARKASELSGSVLIIGPPGSGKTTFLRDFVRLRARKETVAVADERGELFPFVDGTNLYVGDHPIDVLSGCCKARGISAILRTMNPDSIAVDEITAEADCTALVQAAWCGVSLLATAHASSVKDLRMRSIYKPILDCRLFSNVIVLNREKQWSLERL